MTKRQRIVIHFDKPESWKGVLALPLGFDEMDYDSQQEIIEGLADGLRGVSVDYWDYA